MLGKWFGKKKTMTEANAEQPVPPAAEPAEQTGGSALDVAMMRAGAADIVQSLTTAMSAGGRPVRLDDLLAIIGSLGGFCCVDSVLRRAAELNVAPRDVGIVEVETENGERFYMGDQINGLLLESGLSLFALVAGMMNQLGSIDYPAVQDIVSHVAGTLGSDDFGIPRLPDQHRPAEPPLTLVKTLWPALLPKVEHYAPALQVRVTLFGLAAQMLMEMGKDVIDPALAGRIVMECAIPMAKLDPQTVYG